MAANLEVDLSCPVCLEVYREPVLLRCGHNFCKGCIERCTRESEGSLVCPLCRAEFDRDSFYCNRQLANVIAGVLDLRGSSGEGQEGSPQCQEHGRALELFCRDDGRLVCLVCALSQGHKGHDCVLKDQAYKECKDTLECEIASLEEMINNNTTMQTSQGQDITELLDMTERLRDDIAVKFETLHEFLNMKERAITQNLTEKEECILKQLEGNVLILSRERDNVEAIIQDMSAMVNSEDSNQLLKEFASLKERSESIYSSVLNRPDIKLDEFYGPLLYGVWKQMKNVIKIVPSPLRFDPKTANPRLRISNLGRKLIYCEIQSEPPETPERFTNHLSVIASTGLSSGTHYWEVNVSDGSDWFLGVAAASVNRKVCVGTKPENGYWTIARGCGVNYFAYGKERVIINPDVNLETVGVHLDYERGKLSFYDAEDMSHIYTFSDTFTEELYPYFSINCNEQSVAPTLELFHLELVDPSGASSVDSSGASSVDTGGPSSVDASVDPNGPSSVDSSGPSGVDPCGPSSVDTSGPSSVDPNRPTSVDTSGTSIVDSSGASGVDSSVDPNGHSSVDTSVDPNGHSSVDTSGASSVDASVDPNGHSSVDASVDPNGHSSVDTGGSVDASVDPNGHSSVDSSGASSVDTSGASSVDTGGASSVDASVDPNGPSSVDASVDPNGPSSVDTSGASSVDTGGASSVDTGGASSVDASVDPNGPSSVDASVDTSGPSSVDASVDLNGPSSVDASVDPNRPSSVDTSGTSIVDSSGASSVDTSGASSVDVSGASSVDTGGPSSVDASVDPNGPSSVDASVDPNGPSSVDTSVNPSGASSVDSSGPSSVDTSGASSVDPRAESLTLPSIAQGSRQRADSAHDVGHPSVRSECPPRQPASAFRAGRVPDLPEDHNAAPAENVPTIQGDRLFKIFQADGAGNVFSQVFQRRVPHTHPPPHPHSNPAVTSWSAVKLKVAMASSQVLESMRGEAVCSICLDFYQDPVTIDCGHNFCRECIQGYWAPVRGKVACPECRSQFAQRNLRPNYFVSNMVEGVRMLSLGHGEPASRCPEHDESLKMFCRAEQRPICVVCSVSREHQGHPVCPIAEAAELYKGMLQKKLDSLQKQLAEISTSQKAEEANINTVKQQAGNLQNNIAAKFDQLHQLLHQQEQSLRTKLQQKEADTLQKLEQNLDKISEQRLAVERTVEEIQKRLTLQEADFLKDVIDVLDRPAMLSEKPTKVPADLGFGEFSGPLQYMAWKQIVKLINPVPAALHLDPSTAHPRLVVSDGKTSVMFGDSKQQVPDQPTRFTNWHIVLAREGFKSGQHYWEVEVGNNSTWAVGLARGSVPRKKDFSPEPSAGVWALWRLKDEYTTLAMPRTALPVRPGLRTLGVYLDYEAGQVSLYDAVNLSHLCTFTDKFTEKVHPLFLTGCALDPLKLVRFQI
ncbi:uncharacterized protein LOC132832552 [Hemiscyllium ocellatum]|uniref:uncharacterized protein LOC132832552 n=1 Tax=Hemiscyllium ocellatum TaxID=170820 RepID=UPI0029667C61|nr:uncharacterized protein LOC132832552 [Hemiscyllium ocellatum]